MPRIRFEPTAGRFVIEEEIQREQNFGGRTQPTLIHRRAFLAVEVRSVPDQPRPVEILVTVDSLVADPRSSVPGMNLRSLYEAARGLGFEATLERSDDPLVFTGGDTTSQVSHELNGLLQQLFPRIPEDGIVPGVTWSDTASAVSHAARIALEVRSVADHQTFAWTVRDSTEVIEILTSEVYDVSGAGTQAGQVVELTGQGIRSIRTYLDRRGLLWGRDASDSMSMEVRVLSAGVSVPVVQTTRTSTRREG